MDTSYEIRRTWKVRGRLIHSTIARYLEATISRVAHHASWMCLLQVSYLPYIPHIANGRWELALAAMLYSLRPWVLKKDRRKGRRMAIDQGVTTALWLVFVHIVYRNSSSYRSRSLIDLLERLYPTPSSHLIHQCFISFVLTKPTGAKFSLRMVGRLRRFAHFFHWIARALLEVLYFDTVDNLSLVLRFMTTFIAFVRDSLYFLCMAYIAWVHWALIALVLQKPLKDIADSQPLCWLLYRPHGETNYRSLTFLEQFNVWMYYACYVILVLVKGASQGTQKTTTKKHKTRLPGYAYQRLDKDKMRLLVIHPNRLDQPLECTMVQVPVSSWIPYEAVSYCWGKGALRTEAIVDNHRTILITPNAVEVLKRKRSYWQPRVIWIDSICLNQEDKGEKVVQIPNMGDIYRNAFNVAVVLIQQPHLDLFETELKSVSLAMWKTMDYPEVKLKLVNFTYAHLIVDVMEELRWSRFYNMSRGIEACNSFVRRSANKHFIAFRIFLRNEWFERLWVVQEVALASSVTIKYGEVDISWELLIEALEFFKIYPQALAVLQADTIPGILNPMPVGYMTANAMHDLSTKRKNMESLSLAETLILCRNAVPTDPRDKLFAVRALCSELPPGLLDPDYSDSNTAESVFINAAKCFLPTDAARVLSVSGIGYFTARKETGLTGLANDMDRPLILPSWVPDWTRITLVSILSYNSKAINNTSLPYGAGGTSTVQVVVRDDSGYRGVSPTSTSWPSIVVSGVEFDEIAELAEAWDIREQFSTTTTTTQRIYQQWRVVTGSIRLVVMDRDNFCSLEEMDDDLELEASRQMEVFLRTSIANKTAKGIIIDPEHTKTAKEAQNAKDRLLNLCEQFMIYRKILTDMATGQNPALTDPDQPMTPETQKDIMMVQEYSEAMQTVWSGRRFGLTKKGYVALLPPLSEIGDKIVVIPGLQMPMILRPVSESGDQSLSKSSVIIEPRTEGLESNKTESLVSDEGDTVMCQIVGEAYVHGIMMGEVLHPRTDILIWTYEIV